MTDTFVARGAPLEQVDLDTACQHLGVAAAAIWSVIKVETHGFGYLPDRRPQILFERHVFSERTGRRFDAAHPDISNPHRGGYLGGAAEYGRLQTAMALDHSAALESASWGLGQIMGYHAIDLGYPDADAMVTDFVNSEGAQLRGFAAFVANDHHLSTSLVAGDWETFALHYNGSSYKENDYDTKLRDSYTSMAAGPLPDLRLRAAQAWLTYLGYPVQGIDGAMGPHTRTALTKFQSDANIPATGELDQAAYDALKQKAA